jgi:hypothetical protein
MADHYGTLAEANEYHTERGNATWAGNDMVKTSALVRATTWLDARFGPRFPGVRTDGREQPLQWPRVDAMDREGYGIPADEVPTEIKRATFEAALRELVSPGSLAPDYIAANRVKREKVGPLETEYAGAIGAQDVQPVVSIIEDLLYSLLGRRTSSLVGRTVRC